MHCGHIASKRETHRWNHVALFYIQTISDASRNVASNFRLSGMDNLIPDSDWLSLEVVLIFVICIQLSSISEVLEQIWHAVT